MLWGIIIFWLACGILSYGFTFAWLQRGYPECAKEDYEWDRRYAIRSGLLGPFGLIANIYMKEHKYGWKWK